MKAYIFSLIFVVAICNTNSRAAAKSMNLAGAKVKGMDFLRIKESIKTLGSGNDHDPNVYEIVQKWDMWYHS